ncbi:MAG TPA: diacylglycerol kinase family protein [Steroidobacteraceae bacterium]
MGAAAGGPACRWLAIYNPSAGRSRRKRAWARIEQALRQAGLQFDVATTRAAGDAADIAAGALREGTRGILVAGGDGTVHEAVNGLMRDHALRVADDRPTLVPLPLGTGNDWARTLRLPHDPVELARCIAAGRSMLHDVGRIVFPLRQDATHWFINVAGAGFDAHVIERLPAQTPSALAYLRSALVELGRYRSPLFRLACDDRAPVAGRFLLAFVANAEYCGHRMHVAPVAELDDGRLDVVTIDEVGLLRALPKLVKLYRGSILADPLVSHRAVRTVRIDADPEVAVEADGQLVGRTPAVFSLQRQALQVIVGG